VPNRRARDAIRLTKPVAGADLGFRRGSIYPWGNASPTCALANVAGCGGAAKPVGDNAIGASPFGLLDMIGNVEEWTADWYDADAYSLYAANDPLGPAAGTANVRRLGGHTDAAQHLRASARLPVTPPDAPLPYLGFRCARSAP